MNENIELIITLLPAIGGLILIIVLLELTIHAWAKLEAQRGADYESSKKTMRTVQLGIIFLLMIL
tara:strand:+ start:388 stop:582 length:195 start_codon:yes stop_codon:yes gene_type:complete